MHHSMFIVSDQMIEYISKHRVNENPEVWQFINAKINPLFKLLKKPILTEKKISITI